MDSVKPANIFVNRILGADPFCVYWHILGGRMFYIGSGTISRAFEYGPARRNSAWNEFVGDEDVTVLIVATAARKADARRFEYSQIKKYRPIANMPWDASGVLEWADHAPLDGSAFGHASDIGHMDYVECLTTGEVYRNATAAAAATGVSAGAVCNSISGRHPVVAGLMFARHRMTAENLVDVTRRITRGTAQRY